MEPDAQKFFDLIAKRMAFDRRCARVNFVASFLLVFVGIFSGIIAYPLLSKGSLNLYIFGAIAATSICTERIFKFFQRSRWHCTVETELQRFSLSMEFQAVGLKEVSKQFADLMVTMEQRYPSLTTSALTGSLGMPLPEEPPGDGSKGPHPKQN
jgi:hypothetical protein